MALLDAKGCQSDVNTISSEKCSLSFRCTQGRGALHTWDSSRECGVRDTWLRTGYQVANTAMEGRRTFSFLSGDKGFVGATCGVRHEQNLLRASYARIRSLFTRAVRRLGHSDRPNGLVKRASGV
mgnify:CR=1 FL=1